MTSRSSSPSEPEAAPDPDAEAFQALLHGEADRPVGDITIEPLALPDADEAGAEGAASLPAPTPDVRPQLVAATPDILPPAPTAVLPGAHRGGFATPPTAPVEVLADEGAPARIVEDDEPRSFTPSGTLAVAAARSWRPGVSALILAVPALAASFLVGWMLPVGLVALALAIMALRRPGERVAGAWGLALAALSVVYSAGWLVYAAMQLGA